MCCVPDLTPVENNRCSAGAIGRGKLIFMVTSWLVLHYSQEGEINKSLILQKNSFRLYCKDLLICRPLSRLQFPLNSLPF